MPVTQALWCSSPRGKRPFRFLNCPPPQIPAWVPPGAVGASPRGESPCQQGHTCLSLPFFFLSGHKKKGCYLQQSTNSTKPVTSNQEPHAVPTDLWDTMSGPVLPPAGRGLCDRHGGRTRERPSAVTLHTRAGVEGQARVLTPRGLPRPRPPRHPSLRSALHCQQQELGVGSSAFTHPFFTHPCFFRQIVRGWARDPAPGQSDWF